MIRTAGVGILRPDGVRTWAAHLGQALCSRSEECLPRQQGRAGEAVRELWRRNEVRKPLVLLDAVDGW